MKLSDLTREELLLINTDFGEEIEKTASAVVEEEFDKIAASEEVAESCYTYGTELAMEKIAEMEANYEEGEKKDSEDSKDGKNKKGKKEEGKEGEAEKTASAMGNFILEGYWATMMEKGAEYYGDDDIYLEELCKEAGASKHVGKVLKFLKGKGESAVTHAANLKEIARHSAKDIYSGGKQALKGHKAFKKGKTLNQINRGYITRAGGLNKIKGGLQTGAPLMLGTAGIAGTAGALDYGLSRNKKK